jgi:hypothetical protein
MNVACFARAACFDALVRMVLGGLTAVALTLIIAFTAVELASQVGEIRGGGPGAVPASNDDLAELAARLISPPYPMPDGSTQTATLHPGALPPNAGFDLPIPPGAHLVGSVLRQRTNANPSFDTVLDVPGNVDDVTSFYERELGKKGLTTPPVTQQVQPGGFQGSVGPTKGSMFCKGDGLPYVSLSVFSRPNAANDVRVHFEPAQTAAAQQFMGSPCSQRGGPPQGMPAQRLPVLHAPDGVLLQPSGSSIGGPRQQSDAVATTPKTASELESFFAQQLSAAGWTRVAGGGNAPLAFSTWKLPGDGDWQGVLIVIETPTKDRRSLMLRAESPTGQGF